MHKKDVRRIFVVHEKKLRFLTEALEKDLFRTLWNICSVFWALDTLRL